MSDLKLTEQQQLIENGQLARELLSNRIFQEKITGEIAFFRKAVDELEPHDGAAFPIIQAAKKYLMLFLKSIEAVDKAGQDAEKGLKQEGGLL